MAQVLSRVNHPHDLKGLSFEELEELGREIRQRIMEVVDQNGGHLASNLGTVEITLALHRVFDFPRDRLVWDVSHQTYPHKLITGRRDRFHTLRTYRGISGFCNKRESVFDLFDAGHAGTAVSLALGVAVADHLFGRRSKTIAVVGDAAIAAGMAFEALNHAGDLQRNLLVILNDNRMSIDVSVGALSKYLNKVRSQPLYQGLKKEVHEILHRIPVVGKKMEDALDTVRESLKHSLVPGLLFQELGFNYYGPVDGHNLKSLIDILTNLKDIETPIILHAITVKGHGYEPASKNPIKYHALKNFLTDSEKKGSPAPAAAPGAGRSESIPAANWTGSAPASRAESIPAVNRMDGAPAANRVESVEPPLVEARPTAAPAREGKAAAADKPEAKKKVAYTEVFREIMHATARKDRRLVAITAAMPGGTGLVEFGKEFPDRYFDVGIAEQHGGAFSSGLAYGGLRPVFAVYSTFCQRAYDQYVHDICIQENSVILCLDRAGLVGEDGWTHHGVFDIAFLRAIPNSMLMAPRDAEEFIKMFQLAFEQTSVTCAIRYPKANVPSLPPAKDAVLAIGKAEVLKEGEGIVLHAYGAMVDEAWRAAALLEKDGLRVTVVNARFAKPIDEEVLRALSATHHTLVTIEEHTLFGGFGSAVVETLADFDIPFSRVVRLGVPDQFQTFGSREQLLADCGLDAKSIAQKVAGLVSRRRAASIRDLEGAVGS